ncbi:hypothetical protein EVAR_50091_1 [Eumeta japonica]|uniref:Uncharacterized protein n=1 Tax=Eumeta variegata TaxID=151549 RepID=A0A4C1XUS2_EUMVA|nr:hypothetical protein EVAR_50091_1 [Eumeta japonica]
MAFRSSDKDDLYCAVLGRRYLVCLALGPMRRRGVYAIWTSLKPDHLNRCKGRPFVRKPMTSLHSQRVAQQPKLVLGSLSRFLVPARSHGTQFKAFDCVDHDTLIRKLRHYGVRGLSLGLLESYSSSRVQRIDINSERSSGSAFWILILQCSGAEYNKARWRTVRRTDCECEIWLKGIKVMSVCYLEDIAGQISSSVDLAAFATRRTLQQGRRRAHTVQQYSADYLRDYYVLLNFH